MGGDPWRRACCAPDLKRKRENTMRGNDAQDNRGSGDPGHKG
jgi:hypothetical protein